KYCYANDENNCNIYGGLYQWNMAMQFSTSEGVQGICPEGWHIPTDYEFKQLELALSMPSGEVDIMNSFRGHAQNVGGQMKQGGGSGFEALFAGARNGGGGFMFLQGSGSTEFTYFWTSNQCGEGSECTANYDEMYAIRRCLNNGNQGSGRFDTFPKTYGYSIRCVKNN
ncbi:MAG: fibrobacter succinogenes major paralogous domain-containing protein, partial [Bacteroidales bacterium]|nr:fibrobacter succinogenes major paralogous domain-containing protein [Bacteroidales bacterium]